VHRRFVALASAALIVTGLAGCGNTDSWVDAAPSLGWPAQYGDAANSSYTPNAGTADLSLSWTRSVKGDLDAAVALGSGSYLLANAQTAVGCSLMVWENDNNGRQRWCSRLVQGGQPGAILSFPPTQWIRWRQPVIGMPLTPRLLDDGRLLVMTHLGQVLIFDAHRGTVVGTPLDLITGVDPTDSVRGLVDCAPARARCPIAAAPAFSAQSQMVVAGVWEPDAPKATLIGLRYQSGQTAKLIQAWTSDAVTGGVLASPVLSADGKTVYVNGRDNQLWALNAADGSVKWSVPLDFLAQTPPTVAPGGLIVSGGGPDAALTAIRDTGGRGQVVWRRGDVSPLSTASQAGAHIAYTVIAGNGKGGDAAGLTLLAFDPADGHTVGSYSLPAATGYPVGVSIGRDRRVVAATSDGQVYSFAPK
jgi:outer membrane protein assembly factor BamB